MGGFQIAHLFICATIKGSNDGTSVLRPPGIYPSNVYSGADLLVIYFQVVIEKMVNFREAPAITAP